MVDSGLVSDTIFFFNCCKKGIRTGKEEFKKRIVTIPMRDHFYCPSIFLFLENIGVNIMEFR